MKATRTRPALKVSADGVGVVSHAGSRLLADLADRSTLTAELSGVFSGRVAPQTLHDPGRVLVDLAVMIADGGETISDIAALVQQPAVFGAVASDSTCWRTLKHVDTSMLGRIAAARAAVRQVVWAQRAEATGEVLPAVAVGGRPLSDRHGRAVVVIDLDATIVVCHSEKQNAAPTFKHTFGYHPLLAFCDNTSEALAGVLRAGNAGSNTAADHITVLGDALSQVPDQVRHGHPILVRADGAGSSKAFLAHIRSLRDNGVDTEFSVGWSVTDRERAAISLLPKAAWTTAIDTTGNLRDGAEVAELTGVLPATGLADYPTGARVIIRRERPHPGAQLDLIETRDGWRYTCFVTDTPAGQHAWLDARHRAHARVEDRIRCGKDTGIGRFPSREFAINAVWLTLAMIGIDLLTWTQHILLHDQPDLVRAEPKTIRYRLLHVAARIVTTGRRRLLRIDRDWPWAAALTTAFRRLYQLPTPQA